MGIFWDRGVVQCSTVANPSVIFELVWIDIIPPPQYETPPRNRALVGNLHISGTIYGMFAVLGEWLNPSPHDNSTGRGNAVAPRRSPVGAFAANALLQCQDGYLVGGVWLSFR